MKRAYQYRFYPTPEQAQILSRTFGCARYVYNWALRLRTDAYYKEQKRIGYHETSARLTLLKQQADHAWLNEVSSVPPQQALRHLEKAFKNFFEGRANYPTFKKRSGEQTAEYTTSAFKWDGKSLTLAKMDAPLDIHWSRPLPKGCKPTTVTVSFSVLHYELPVEVATVSIKLFDAKGRLIRRLVNNEPSGMSREVVWDGLDQERQRARVGIYIILVEGLNQLGGNVYSAKGVVVLAAKL